MLDAPEFSSLLVSRPRPRALLFAKVRGLAVAATLYALGLTALIVAPLLVLEVVDPPKAGVEPPRVIFNPPSGRSDPRPAGNIKKGVRSGRMDAHPAATPRSVPPPPAPGAADPLAPPPEPATSVTDASVSGTDTSAEPYGDPHGKGSDPTGIPGGCDDCPGVGPGGKDGIDEPFFEGTAGLVPPTLIPGSRALPKYPDLARKAGLQGTVILLAVIEKDGTVGEIEVVKSPDQRWGFDLATIDAVKQWRYQPALMNGGPVAAYIQVMVEFTLAR
jgi:protein TonB